MREREKNGYACLTPSEINELKKLKQKRYALRRKIKQRAKKEQMDLLGLISEMTYGSK